MLCGDRRGMAHSTTQLYGQRIDDSKNMARYYAMSIQPTLFGEVAVVRHWGRIGRAGGEKIEVFETEEEATAHFLEIARRKRAKGYRPFGSCGNPTNSSVSPQCVDDSEDREWQAFRIIHDAETKR
jgi:predicted DNA-binding WGR domain protein